MTLLVVDVAGVTPTVDSDSTNSLTIPLTFFDLRWLSSHPTKRLFFYKLTELTRDHFHSFILPKLKLSLSVVLRHYLPLTGRIIWEQQEPKPIIVVTQNDAVSLTIAETDSDFSILSGFGQRSLSELLTLIPELPVSDDSATALSLQITLFPNRGFSVGVALHHSVLDGKSFSMFFRAWALMCKHHCEGRVFTLPENLTPSFDRSLIKDLTEIDEKIIAFVRSLKDDKTDDETRSLSPLIAEELEDDVVHATVVMSPDDIQRLRERVISESSKSELHLSTLVVSYAYTWTCFVKARGGNGDRSVSFAFPGDFRERLDPPLPATYFGNCMFPVGLYNVKAATFLDERGFVTAVEILSDLVKGFSARKIETITAENAALFSAKRDVTSQFGLVTSSTRLKLYETDFGWGMLGMS